MAQYPVDATTLKTLQTTEGLGKQVQTGGKQKYKILQLQKNPRQEYILQKVIVT